MCVCCLTGSVMAGALRISLQIALKSRDVMSQTIWAVTDGIWSVLAGDESPLPDIIM